jgi:hypothetical protein
MSTAQEVGFIGIEGGTGAGPGARPAACEAAGIQGGERGAAGEAARAGEAAAVRPSLQGAVEGGASRTAAEVAAGPAETDAAATDRAPVERPADHEVTSSLPATKEKTAAHAGGALGERDLGYAMGREGLVQISQPAEAGIPGEARHGLTEGGIDAAYVDPKDGDLYLVDNKAYGQVRTVRECSSLTDNLPQNLEAMRGEIAKGPDHPYKQGALDKLDAAIVAAKQGERMPEGVHLVVTNAGGYARGISRELMDKGLEFKDVVPPGVRAERRADLPAARERGVDRAKLGRPVRHPEAAHPSTERPPSAEGPSHRAPERAEPAAHRSPAEVEAYHQAPTERSRTELAAHERAERAEQARQRAEKRGEFFLRDEEKRLRDRFPRRDRDSH